MKKSILLLLVLLLPLCFAETIEPKRIGAASAKVSLVWHVDLSGQQLNQLNINTFGFQDYESQKLMGESTNPPTAVSTDVYGNKIRTFSLPTRNYQSFSMDSDVDVKFTFNFPPASNAAKFLKESQYVKISPEIREKAYQISSLYGTNLEKAAALAEWVHNNVIYDPAYINLVKGSTDVFAERAGTCDEFSHLYLAMLRSIGIPGKFSASYVFSGTDWGAHAFTEAAIDGKWIPFDPTFNEGVILDATHIKFGEGMDQGDIKEDITIRGANTDVSRIKLSREFDVQFKDTSDFPQLFFMDLVLPDKEVGEGSIETIKVHLKNRENTIAVPLVITVPKEASIIGENKFHEDRLVVLQPFEEKDVIWKMIIPKLDEGFEYKFPVVVDSLGQEVNGTIRASKSGALTKAEDFQITDIASIEKKNSVEITVTLKNTGNVDTAGKITLTIPNEPDQEQDFAILSGDEGTMKFSIPKPGREEVRGQLIVAGKDLRLTQPFTLSFGGTPTPGITSAPAGSEIPTTVPQSQNFFEGIQNEYLAFGIALLLVLILIYKGRKAKDEY